MQFGHSLVIVSVVSPLAVKRMIWELDENLFKDEISLLFEQYLKTRTQLVTSAEAPALLAALFSQAAPGSSLVATDPALQSFLGLPARARRRDPLVVQLADAVAGSRELLVRLLHFTRTLFLHSRNVAYCLLRSDVLLSLHERNALPSELPADAAIGPALRLLLSLDSCVRELQAAAPIQQPAAAPAHSQSSQATLAHSPQIDAALLDELADLQASLSLTPADKESKRQPRLADRQLQQLQQLHTYVFLVLELLLILVLEPEPELNIFFSDATSLPMPMPMPMHCITASLS